MLLALSLILGLAAISAGVYLILHLVFMAISGWGRLARSFAALDPPRGPRYTGQTVGVGAARFRNCATLCATPGGLYLSTFLLRPALLIPWREFRGTAPATVYNQPAMRVSIGAPEIGSLTLWPWQYERIRTHLPA